MITKIQILNLPNQGIEKRANPPAVVGGSVAGKGGGNKVGGDRIGSPNKWDGGIEIWGGGGSTGKRRGARGRSYQGAAGVPPLQLMH